jgi:hypothetical protein
VSRGQPRPGFLLLGGVDANRIAPVIAGCPAASSRRGRGRHRRSAAAGTRDGRPVAGEQSAQPRADPVQGLADWDRSAAAVTSGKRPAPREIRLATEAPTPLITDPIRSFTYPCRDATLATINADGSLTRSSSGTCYVATRS